MEIYHKSTYLQKKKQYGEEHNCFLSDVCLKIAALSHKFSFQHLPPLNRSVDCCFTKIFI